MAFFSVVPSPYQRDLFAALQRRPEVALEVFYLEAASPDSPWPEKPLAAYERVLPGGWFPIGKARIHYNRLPALNGYDVIVCNTLLSSLTGQWLMRSAVGRKPWFFWGERQGTRNFLRDRLAAPLQRATGIAAVGSLAVEEYRARFPKPAHFNIPYHCSLEAFQTAPRSENAEPVFLFCGQMIARKGVDLLLAAFAQLSRGKLLLIGREAELPMLLAPLPASVRARITYAGFQAPEALPAYFAQADASILPSRYDGWGVVLNQALGAGLPIICSEAVGGGRDLVREDENGAVFPTGDAQALSAIMQRLLDAPELIAKWGAASRHAADNWTPEAGAAKWIAAFREVGVL